MLILEVIGNAIVEFVVKFWLQWVSIFFVALGLFGLYLVIGGAEALSLDSSGRIYLALILIGIWIMYTVFCVLHERFEKSMKAKGLDKKTEQEHKKKLSIRLIITISIYLVITLTAFFLLPHITGGKDGEYVIWADEYSVALTSEVHNSYYLSGAEIGVRGDELYDYPTECVLTLDFKDDDTFTISCDGKMLGMAPGHNGIGHSETNTGTLWKAVDLGDGTCRIVNVNEGAYLKWYSAENNWTTHEEIIEKYADQYILCMQKVG